MKVSALFAKGLVTLVLTMLALPSVAQVNDKAPKPIIEYTTTQIMSIIEEAPEYFDEDPDRFYGEMARCLMPPLTGGVLLKGSWDSTHQTRDTRAGCGWEKSVTRTT